MVKQYLILEDGKTLSPIFYAKDEEDAKKKVMTYMKKYSPSTVELIDVDDNAKSVHTFCRIGNSIICEKINGEEVEMEFDDTFPMGIIS